MKTYLVNLGAKVAALGTLLAPFSTLAVTGPPLPNANVNNLQGVINTICAIAGWMFAFLVVLAIIFVLVAAFKYLTAGGDPTKVSSANYMLIYAAVAIAIGLLARGFPFFVSSFFNVGTFNGC